MANRIGLARSGAIEIGLARIELDDREMRGDAAMPHTCGAARSTVGARTCEVLPTRGATKVSRDAEQEFSSSTLSASELGRAHQSLLPPLHLRDALPKLTASTLRGGSSKSEPNWTIAYQLPAWQALLQQICLRSDSRYPKQLQGLTIPLSLYLFAYTGIAL